MGRLLREIEIGDWYETPLTAERFEVVAVDDASQTVEIQYYDGTIEEVEFESWSSLEVEESAPPDDGTGAFDADRETLNDDWYAGNGWDNPLDEIDQLFYGNS